MGKQRSSTNLLSLLNSAREAVQDETVLALGAVKVLLDHTDHNLVRDQLTAVHDFLGGLSKRGARSDSRAQKVSGGQMAHTIGLHQVRRLRSLTRSRGSQQNDANAGLLRSRRHCRRNTVRKFASMTTGGARKCQNL